MTVLIHIIDGERYIYNVGFSPNKESLDDIIKRDRFFRRVNFCLIGTNYDENIDNALPYFVCKELGLNMHISGLVNLFGIENCSKQGKKTELSELVYFLEGYDMLKKVNGIIKDKNITPLGEYHFESSPGLWKHIGFSFDL